MRSRKNSLANNNIIEEIRLRADFFLNFAEGKHNFLKKFDQNFQAMVKYCEKVLKNA